jgi:predicted methyltransferase
MSDPIAPVPRSLVSGLIRPSRRSLIVGAGMAGLVAACDRKKAAPEVTPDTPPVPEGPPEGSLAWAIAGDWRGEERARDEWRHPFETLRFFDLQPKMTVVDFWPGSGWYTEILAPYLARNGGKYVAVNFQAGLGNDPAQAALVTAYETRYGANPRLYGQIEYSDFGPTSGPVSEANSADLVLFMSRLHHWMAAGIAEKAFADAFSVLRPGAILGIEQHRLGADKDQDPIAASGYVQEAYVRQLAAEAGFIFVAASEINANERDDRDHPFGVDTLPPMRLTAPQGQPADPDFDREPYDEIGESDRMTLKFRKPE